MVGESRDKSIVKLNTYQSVHKAYELLPDGEVRDEYRKALTEYFRLTSKFMQDNRELAKVDKKMADDMVQAELDVIQVAEDKLGVIFSEFLDSELDGNPLIIQEAVHDSFCGEG